MKEQIGYFSETMDIDTLLIYFSCHGNKENQSFILASDSDSFTKEEFQNELKRLKNIKTLLIVLDRCFPPSLNFDDDKDKYVLINACGHDEETSFSTEFGSTFTQYFIKGLKGRSERDTCNEECEICDDFWRKNTYFITVSHLFDFVEKHVKKKSNNESTPTLSGKHILRNIAFYTDDKVYINFLECETNTVEEVPLEYFRDMEELETKLLNDFKSKKIDVNTNIHVNSPTLSGGGGGGVV